MGLPGPLVLLLVLAFSLRLADTKKLMSKKTGYSSHNLINLGVRRESAISKNRAAAKK